MRMTFVAMTTTAVIINYLVSRCRRNLHYIAFALHIYKYQMKKIARLVGNQNHEKRKAIELAGNFDCAYYNMLQKAMISVNFNESTDDEHDVEAHLAVEDDDDSLDIDDSGWETDLEVEESKGNYDDTGRKTYIEACRLMKVTPVSFFSRNLHLTEVDLKHHGLGAAGAKAIAITLVSNTSILKVNLADNWIGDEGGCAIAEMMKENCYLTHLNMAGNRLSYKSGLAIAEMLQQNATLLDLNISNNEFDLQLASEFADAFRANTRLITFNLSKNKFDEKAGTTLGPAIGFNSSIENLDLSWNAFRRTGAIAIAVSLKNNVSLKKLDLSWNGFADEGAIAMGDALKHNNVLLELDLSNNRIFTPGIVGLAEGLAVNETLEILKISYNPIECFPVLTFIKMNLGSALREIQLFNVQVDEHCEEVMKSMKETHPDLKFIYGGGGAQLGRKGQPKRRPMQILREYITDQKMRLIDFFFALDKDKSMSITRDEFRTGIRRTNVPLREEELEQLLDELDKDGDGEINFSELVLGANTAKEGDRFQQKAENLKQKVQEDKIRNILSPPDRGRSDRSGSVSKRLSSHSRSRSRSRSPAIRSPSPTSNS
ncbi:Leucine-rich repeat-containing protein 74A [Trichoplax sp. H2]|nr:Leucine-rich repeat-containing protein 74A [Trichoplax sp. H2]|eukprot:RDD38066.1 Leucine-rich repeat-containing protein 74A [Trichoplax sp. H2]